MVAQKCYFSCCQITQCNILLVAFRVTTGFTNRVIKFISSTTAFGRRALGKTRRQAEMPLGA